MALLTLGLFCASLLLTIILDVSILYALVFGLAVFLLYGRHRGFSWDSLLRIVFNGIKTVKTILITFLLIGMLTALWRAAGTVPAIVCYASSLVKPSVLIVMTFLLNGCVSFLTGTSFGTAATMGVICAAMGNAVGADIRLLGGAVLSGAFFGDRCSPVSTSALLVAQITETDIYDNIRRMLRSAFIPFLLTCAIYTVLGFRTAPAGELPDLRALFTRVFAIHPVALVPAAVVLLLSVCRVNVRIALGTSILTSVPVCLFLQRIPFNRLPAILLSGYHAPDADVAAMIDGGGILSMIRVTCIIIISSSYSGLFKETGLLDGAKHTVEAVARRTSPFAAILFTSIFTSMIACNQTLASMLTCNLCQSLNKDRSDFALAIEDTAIVIAPLVPWSIAGAVPLASVGAPAGAYLFASYLYVLPLWRLVISFRKKTSFNGF